VIARAALGRAALAACAAALVAAGCTLPRKPIELRVASAGGVPARIEIREDPGSSPLECRAPCVVKLKFGAEVELALSADGYHAVALPLAHSALAWGGKQIDLVIPLVERADREARSRPAPPEPVPEPREPEPRGEGREP
jgi:hypothetical protein